MADALRSGRSGRKPVGVRVSPSAPSARLTQEDPPVDATPRDLDLAILAHLRGYPEELRRFSNLIKQANPHGRTAAEFYLSRPVAEETFLAALIRFVRTGEDIVTVVEAAELLGIPPSALLEPAHRDDLPAPLWGEGRYRLWRRADVLARRAGRTAGG